MGMKTAIRIVEQDDDGTDIAFRADVIAGLCQAQKAIPARWFYDLRGSELFEEITRLPEYYPTRVETDLLRQCCPQVAQLTGLWPSVVEFGSGSSVKTPTLLSAVKASAYVPIDISGEFLRQSSAELALKFPDLAVMPVEADFMRRVDLPPAARGKVMLGFFPGSTIGNMVARTAVNLLRSMRETLGQGAWLLIGVDQVKDKQTLIDAYDDGQGVTAQFNLNLLERINRELGSEIDISKFRHVARWNADYGRIEMHLQADEDLSFSVAGRNFSMAKGETIHTENSHKYRPAEARLLLNAGGWTTVEQWSDNQDNFMLILARAMPERMAP